LQSLRASKTASRKEKEIIIPYQNISISKTLNATLSIANLIPNFGNSIVFI